MLETKTVTNGPTAMEVQRSCCSTLRWLILFSLGPTLRCERIRVCPEKGVSLVFACAWKHSQLWERAANEIAKAR